MFGDTLLIVGGGSGEIFSRNADDDEVELASWTLAVKENVPTPAGVPAILPVEEFN
jgi:hypothetical protein